MIAPITAAGSGAPSSSVLKAAKAAASSKHGLINLTRLVRSLDNADPVQTPGEDEGGSTRWINAKKEWETVLYTRALLDALRTENEQSSTTTSQLNELDKILIDVEIRYRAVQGASPAPTPSIQPVKRTLSSAPSASVQATSLQPSPSQATETIPPTKASSSTTTRRRHPPPLSTSEYLAARQREDAQGGEAGLLPLKTQLSVRGGGENPKKARDQVLGGSGTGGLAMGSAELHEELGGQLADMSHRLKLNALHFASALEEEKSLLDSSQQVLEGNLASTRSSKKHLSTVSRKSRGTTCMTLGIVILVLIIFVWTYMLIRFT